jgi:class 3 adenylate cyclase
MEEKKGVGEGESSEDKRTISKQQLVRFVSATQSQYYTIPIYETTTVEEAAHKIEQKILASGLQKSVKIYERVASEFPLDRELGQKEFLFPLMEGWKTKPHSCFFVVREFDVVHLRDDGRGNGGANKTVAKRDAEELLFRSEITTFLPDYVKNIYLFSLGAPNKPACEVFPAAVMFVDIAGFTSFTEKLAKLGEIGMETLCIHLNELFGLLISVVRRNYGDVIQFGGDSVLILWESPLATLPELVLQACECAIQIQEVFADYHTRQAHSQSAGIKLSLYVAIAAGDMNNYHVGAPGKWSIVFAGDPILQIAREMGHCAPGEIVVSPEAWNILQNSSLSDGQKGKEILRGRKKVAGGQEQRRHGGLLGLFSQKKRAGEHAQQQEEEDLPYLLQAVRPPPGDRKAQAMRKKAVTPTAAYYMRAYVSKAILACVDTGLMDWIRELRHVAVLFLNLPDLDDFESEDFLPTLQLATEILQSEIPKWEGNINKFIMDDKGCLLLCAFGLPLSPTTHLATRAVLAALRIKRLMDRAKITATMGITFGKNYCGLIGSRQRQEFTIMGDYVNLAARLMKVCGLPYILRALADRVGFRHFLT